MLLAIEIGGTKLQLAVGRGDGRPPAALQRLEVVPADGAEGIRRTIERVGRRLVGSHRVRAVGIGFGGPVDVDAGRTLTSHQIDGWDDFPLVDWCRRVLGLPAVLSNDSDAAGLAEARFGAGRAGRVVFYSNVGSGIGGALVIDGRLFRGGLGVAAELGQLRPGLSCRRADQTVEAMASGWAIGQAARARLASAGDDPDAVDLLRRSGGQAERLDAKTIADAALAGNRIARAVLDDACRAYGWGLAQMITLVAPNIVVLGGGVSQVGEELFFAPVRRYVGQYTFGPLAERVEIVSASLGQEVVLYGALALAAATRGGHTGELPG